MNDIKLLAFDIDGTILPYGKNDIEESTKEAFKILHQKGYKLMISTGRCSYFIPHNILKNISSDYFVTINGTLITDGKFNTLKMFPMSEDNFNKLIETLDKYDIAAGFKFEKAIAIYKNYDLFVSEYISGKVDPKLLVNDKEYHLKHGMPLDMYIIGPNHLLSKFAEETNFMDWVGFLDKEIGQMECYSKGFSKASGIDYVLKKMNISMNNVMSFGDSDNDIDMLSRSGIGVAMGNAKKEVKEIADYVTDDCGKDGVYKALKHFDLI